MQPLQPHDHWHIDVSYINVQGTFYFLLSVLDGMSRFLVHGDLRESMKEQEVELVLQQALEKHPGVKPRIISDNGPQFLARDFKLFIRLVGATHVRTSPYDPQSNGKLERWHGSLKRECIRPICPASMEEARQRIAGFVEHYNAVRLHSALGYLTPADKLAGLDQVIHDERDRKLEEARQHQCAKPVRHDAPLSTARRLFPFANHNRPKSQFTLNQDTTAPAVTFSCPRLIPVIRWCYWVSLIAGVRRQTCQGTASLHRRIRGQEPLSFAELRCCQ